MEIMVVGLSIPGFRHRISEILIIGSLSLQVELLSQMGLNR